MSKKAQLFRNGPNNGFVYTGDNTLVYMRDHNTVLVVAPSGAKASLADIGSIRNALNEAFPKSLIYLKTIFGFSLLPASPRRAAR